MAPSKRRSGSTASHSASLLWSTTCAVFASPSVDSAGDSPQGTQGKSYPNEREEEKLNADHVEDGASTDPGDSAIGDAQSLGTGESITEIDGSSHESVSDRDDFSNARRSDKSRSSSDAESLDSWASCMGLVEQDASIGHSSGAEEAETEPCLYTRGALLQFRDNATLRENPIVASPYLPLQAQLHISPHASKTSPQCRESRSPPPPIYSPSAVLFRDPTVFDDADVSRSVKGILNKLTVEKFEALYEKLLTSCCIRTKSHMQLLVAEIFEKATTQRHFVGMYADLCVRLEQDLGQLSLPVSTADAHHAEVGDGCGSSFRRALLDQCQIYFERSLQQVNKPKDGESSDRRDLMLGNVRLLGELIVRRMLSSNVLVTGCEDLLQQPLHPDRLEALAALLTCTGPYFDDDAWPRHASLKVVFWQLQGLCCDVSVPSRVRCLLRDVVDLRDAGWVNKKMSTQRCQPKRIAEVHCDAALESIRSPFCQQEKVLTTSSQSLPTQMFAASTLPSTANAYDLAEFHCRLADAMQKLAVDHNPATAASQIRMLHLPPPHQAPEFANILTRALEEPDRSSRKSAFAFAIALTDPLTDGAFSQQACVDGVDLFFQGGIFDDLCDEVPGLVGIVSMELLPSFHGILPSARIAALRRLVARSATQVVVPPTVV